MFKQRVTFLSVLCISFSSNVQAKGYDFIERFLEQSFAYTIVMSDSDVFTVGFADFNPNNLFNTNNDKFGTDDSVENRQKYGISTLPMSFRLNDENETNKQELLLRLSGLATEDKVRWPEDTIDDELAQVILDVYTAYRYEYVIDEHWSVEPGIGAHLMYYDNSMTYNSATGKSYAPILDDLLFNTSAWANIYEPHLKIAYKKDENWGNWKVTSSGHYFYGYGWGEANEGNIGHPEGWYWVNSASVTYDFSHLGRSVQSVYSTIRRVDVGSDAVHNLGTSVYYEATFGWLMTPPFEIKFVDNIGLGLTFNYGSAFTGGSVVLFFNQS